MASADGSVRVVVMALLANAGIAVAKLVAGLVTRSSAMLAEAVHSFADAGNQGLLLVGHRRSKRPADEDHPLGYGREAYYWAMLVAVLLFFMGGAYSLYEGVHKLQHPEPVRHPLVAIGVLALGLVLEGISLRAAWIEAKKVRGTRGLLAWARETGRVNLLVVVFEDMAAQLGLLLAMLAIVLTMVTGNPIFDAIGTCAIGVLLILVALFLAGQIRRLIAGFRVPVAMRREIRAVWEGAGFEILHLIAIWSGPADILVALKVRHEDATMDAAALVERINAAEVAARERIPEIDMHFVEPDTVA